MVQSFQELFITFSIVSLFVFGTISFVVLFQQENGVTETILANDLINSTFIDLGANIADQSVSSNSSQDAFNSEVPAPGFGSLIIFAIVGVAQTFTSLITTIWNIIIILPLSILGVPTEVANVFGSILIVSLIFLAWRVYRVGS